MNEVQAFLGFDESGENFSQVIVHQRCCTPHLFLYGGAGLAISIEALAHHCHRPVIWATTQYIGQAHPDEHLELDVVIGNEGKNFTQACLQAAVGERQVLNTVATLGGRHGEEDRCFTPMPQGLPDPADCEPHFMADLARDYILGQFEIRNISGPGAFSAKFDGKICSQSISLFWVRFPGIQTVSAGSLAILGDLAPSTLSGIFGKFLMARSLDNSIRIIGVEQTEWILCEVEIHSVRNGIAHCTQKMWAESGKLMAIATQSCVVREMDGKAFTSSLPK